MIRTQRSRWPRGARGKPRRRAVPLLLIALMPGCSRPVLRVNPESQRTWIQLNERAGEEKVTLHLVERAGSDSVTVKLRVRDAVFAPDTTRWTTPLSGMESAIETDRVPRITFDRRTRGIRRGIGAGGGTGLLLGAVAGTLISELDNNSPESAGVAIAGTALLGLGGALIGGVLGSQTMTAEDVVFRRVTLPETSAPSVPARRGDGPQSSAWWEALNERAERESVMLRFLPDDDGRPARSLSMRTASVHFAPDSTVWTAYPSRVPGARETAALRSVSFRSWKRGAGKGALVGALSGAGAGAAFGWLARGFAAPVDRGDFVATFTVITGTLFAAVGTAVGAMGFGWEEVDLRGAASPPQEPARLRNPREDLETIQQERAP